MKHSTRIAFNRYCTRGRPAHLQHRFRWPLLEGERTSAAKNKTVHEGNKKKQPNASSLPTARRSQHISKNSDPKITSFVFAHCSASAGHSGVRVEDGTATRIYCSFNLNPFFLIAKQKNQHNASSLPTARRNQHISKNSDPKITLFVFVHRSASAGQSGVRVEEGTATRTFCSFNLNLFF